jgi:hypothetical protein
MDTSTQSMVESAYFEAVQESIERGITILNAHKEGVIAGAMLLAALLGLEDDAARSAVIALNLRPNAD